MKKISMKIRDSTLRLHLVQSKIKEYRRLIAELQLEEQRLIPEVGQVLTPTAEVATEESLVILGMHYTVKYRYIDRTDIDLTAVERHYLRINKPLPIKHSPYFTLRVVKR